VTLQRADKPRDARDRATLQRAEESPANSSRSATASSTDRPHGILDRRRGEPDAPCPSRRTLDPGELTPNTLSVFGDYLMNKELCVWHHHTIFHHHQ